MSNSNTYIKYQLQNTKWIKIKLETFTTVFYLLDTILEAYWPLGSSPNFSTEDISEISSPFPEKTDDEKAGVPCPSHRANK